MHSWVQRLLPCGLAGLILAGSAASADLATARKALESKDYVAAFKELTPLAKQGNPEAQVLLGRMYLMGYGVLKDAQEAHRWFASAAVQGDASAEFFLGAPSVLHHTNIPNGLTLLQLSAEQGNQDAQLLLGRTYLQGIEPAVPRDPVKAEMWLTLAAKDNLPFYKGELETADKQMSAEEAAKGKALAAAWKPKRGLKPDPQLLESASISK